MKPFDPCLNKSKLTLMLNLSLLKLKATLPNMKILVEDYTEHRVH